MMKSGNRTSRMSTRDATAENDGSPFPEIEDSKWNEMLQEEERDAFILDIRDEIMQRCMEMCYASYMDRQAVAFTIHCSYLAWVKVIDMYYMPRDEGDEDLLGWEPDEEPEPSIVDSWATQFMSISREPSRKEETTSDQSSVTSETETKGSTGSVPSVYYPVRGECEGEEFEYLEIPGESLEVFSPRKESIFTRTLSMPREQLLLFEPFNLALGQCREEAISIRKRIAEEAFRPTFIDVSNVQPNRIDVGFRISNDTQQGKGEGARKKKE